MNAIDFHAKDVHMPRVAQHVLFWVIVSFLITSIYSVQVDFLTSLRNNAFYMPIQIAYYYALAYWLVPAYLFKGKYFQFLLLFILLATVSVLVSRSIGLIFVIPYLITKFNITDVDYLASNRGPFLESLFNKVSLVNALKGTNLTIGFVMAIKLFKMWYERKQAALEAELNALKAQVHPHFLFNTLNNLYALSLNQSPKSPQIILGLSGLLRYMLYECNTEKVLLEREVFMMQQYIKLEKLRYEDRIDISFNINGNLKDKLIAPLLILPFIENAFKHGTSEKTGQVWINIDITVKGESFKLKVANSKPEKKITAGENNEGHIGLKNAVKRLDLLYPGISNLKIMDEEDAFLIVLNLDLKLVSQRAKQDRSLKQLATV